MFYQNFEFYVLCRLFSDGVNCLLVAVLNFDLRRSCVMVNIDRLECHEVTFTSSLTPSRPNPDLEQLLNEEKNRQSQDTEMNSNGGEEGNEVMENLMGESDDDMDL